MFVVLIIVNSFISLIRAMPIANLLAARKAIPGKVARLVAMTKDDDWIWNWTILLSNWAMRFASSLPWAA